MRQLLSGLVARKRNAWHKFDDRAEEFQLEIDCDRFVQGVKNLFRISEREREVLSEIEHFELVYEDCLESPEMHQETIDRVLAQLDLEPRKVETRHRKVNAKALNEVIVNYDEFVERIEKEGWKKFLDD